MENSADMLGHLSIPHYSCQSTVTMWRVQTISREGGNSPPTTTRRAPTALVGW